MKIFIVEDHEDTMLALTRYLRGKGFETVCASTMQEALEAIPVSGCDVLLSDLGLPDGTGWELLQALKTNTPPYAIAMSGYGSVSDRRRSQEAGFQHHLLKPFNMRELTSMLALKAEELNGVSEA
ncbi:MAG: hypothetical protein JWO89_3713 [Verrucomicrobiaceae bacterium]|nr:hypothetical protein [Verrucomicrobiaceae bacterium]